MPIQQQGLLLPAGVRRNDFIKGICSPGSLGPNPGRLQLDSAALMLHSYQKEMLSLTFQMLQSGKYFFIFFNEHRKKKICIETF